MENITFGVLTISDRCARNECEDESGPNLVRLIKCGPISNGVVVVADIVPDDFVQIQEKLRMWCDDLNVNVILTTGGTGLSHKDVTPEATIPLLDKHVPGISDLIFKYSSQITPMACLSRGVCGIRGKSLIINFPGSKRASQECFEIVAKVLGHAVDLIKDFKSAVSTFHGEVPSEAGCHSRVSATDIINRSRKSDFRLHTVDEAQKIIKTVLRAEVDLAGNVKNADLNGCLGYILAEDITSKDPLPPYPASMKDGYAVIADDFSDVKTVLGFSSAGDAPDTHNLKPGFCVRVNTGACIPAGANAVVQVEDTELISSTQDGEELRVFFETLPYPGLDIRETGSDIRIGEKVLERGAYLGPSELGVLAAVGASSIKVYDKPKVGVISTGNELQDAGESLHAGKIRDSNRITLLSLLQENGFPSLDLGIVRDSPDDLYKSLKIGFEKVDVLVTSGGVSMGEKDYLKQVLVTDFGAIIHFGRVLMKPGKPTCFASFKGIGKTKLWFGLPGNPVSATVTSYLFLLPALKIMSGYRAPYPPRISVKLTEDIVLDKRPEYRRAILSYTETPASEPNFPSAKVTGNQISSRLMSCVSASCLLELPPASESEKSKLKGSVVNALLIRIP